jgi:hypothetical protein
VYWQVGTSATLGTGSSFQGTIMALTSITVTTGTTVKGRALARNGQVTLDTNAFIAPTCQSSLPTTTPTATGRPTSTPPRSASPPNTGSAQPVSSGSRAPRKSVAPKKNPVSAGTPKSAGSRYVSLSRVPGTQPTPTPQLAQTGATPPLVLGIVLLIAGSGLVVITRRRGVHRA